MVLLGKTSTTEFASGGMDLFGTARNPWDLTRYTGGSSAGSASALASGLALAATGSDTGGSIRVPSSFCGIVGVKPTFGRVSRHGVITLSYTMDHAGPMARTVGDCALMLQEMAGYDPLDTSTAAQPVPRFSADLGKGLNGIVLGVPRQHFFDGLDPEVEAAIKSALRHYEGLGARLEEVHLPHASDLAAVGTVLISVEAFSQHAGWLRTRARDYGARSRRRFSSGAFYSAAEYLQAVQLRKVWMKELDAALQTVDGLVTPTLPFPAFTIEVQESEPPDTSWGTRHFNLSGHPALSMPCGFTGRGLPIGMQLAAKAFDEAALFRIAHAYEESTPWHERRPPLEEVSHDLGESRMAAGGSHGAGIAPDR